MLRLLNYIYFVLLLAVIGPDASAFSMIGAPNTTWHTLRLGYQGLDAQIGFPLNLGEEYRWNAPLLYYGVDGTFLDYFGERGREEIDKAVKVLNDLPKMSDLNLDNYPLKSERSNYRAQALGLIDLKSFALGTLVEEMGLGSPSRFVFTLRNRWIPGPAPTNYLVIKRNFDPVTLTPSSYINGDLWTYITIIDEIVPGASLVINGRVDPLAYGNPVADLIEGFTSFGVGSFFTGLTRDDVGGLRYMYNPANRNIENPVTNAFGAVFGGGPILSTGGGQANGSPWEPFLISTNGTGGVVGGSPGSPWSPITVNTNTTTPPAGGAGGGGGITTPTNNFISTALRGGIDKVSFVRVDYDSLLGQFIAPVLDSFSDTFITNGGSFSQSLQRIVTRPDILFTAGDLAQGDTSGVFPFIGRTVGWQNNAALNNRTIAGDSGPGTIQPSVSIIFSTFGPAFVSTWPAPLSEDSSPQLVTWGSFDGTTNEPVVYPNGTSVSDLERLLLAVP